MSKNSALATHGIDPPVAQKASRGFPRVLVKQQIEQALANKIVCVLCIDPGYERDKKLK